MTIPFLTPPRYPNTTALRAGEEHTVDAATSAKLTVCEEQCLSSKVDNLITLNDLNEHSILHNLRIRFKLDMIYTSVSSILISVNPFKMLPLYTPEIMESYVQGARGKDPHVFSIGYQAYHNMMSDGSNQSVIISGESGAGKSEATKLILQFLSDLSGRASAGSAEDTSHIEQQILQANPIMEAFGNAKTVRNNNSSRFGKLITVKFKGGCIQGASIINYLLEKSRVVMQSKGERNYHIFYQLLSACECDQTLKSDLGLDGPDMYEYLNKSGITAISGVSDEKEFDDMVRAMDTLGFQQEEKSAVWRLVAAVLVLGNVKFEVDVKANAEDGAKIANMDVLSEAAKLIEVNPDELAKSLCFRNVGNRSVILVSYNKEQASTMRDALAKSLYGDLFQYLINRINETINQNTEGATSVIGVLDIFGFECFVSNSFEQMCINYCNEKLQFHFNEHIFRLEQEMYAAEGVVVPSTDFKDNQPTLDLLEKKSEGIFAMIDEEINVPKGSDVGFLNKAITRHSAHPNFDKPKPKACQNAMNCFGIKHYAGTVYYDVNNFLEKNKDSLHPDVQSVIKASASEFLAKIQPKEAEAAAPAPGRGRGGKSKKQTLGGQFKKQQQDLMDTLNATYPHFVRCMKPNKVLKGSVFEEDLMLAQLRYSGLLEVCRIRKLGFPVRRDFDEFYKRYKCIAPSCGDLDSLIAKLTEEGKLPATQFQKGHTKVFMKNAISAELDDFRDEAFLFWAIKVQTVIRGCIMRLRLRSWLKILDSIKSAIADRNEVALSNSLHDVAELPFHGVHIQLVKDAKKLQQRLVEEKEVAALLQNAISSRDLDVLRSAVTAANSMSPPLSHPSVNEATSMIAVLEAELALKAELKSAITARDHQQLEELLIKAESLNLECEETRQASALKLRLEEEEEAVNNLKQAIADRNLNNLSAFLAKMNEMGLDTKEVREGRALEESLLAEVKAKSAIVAAIAERRLESVEAALKKAADLGLTADSKEVADGNALLSILQEEKTCVESLESALEARNLELLNQWVGEASRLSLNSSKVAVLAEAIAMIEVIGHENVCKSDLSSAAASGDVAALSAALAKASELGITGSELEAANTAMSKLGAEAAMSTKLLNAGQLKVAEIEALIAEAQAMGLKGDSVAAAQASLERVKEADALVNSMLSCDDFQQLKKLYAQAQADNLPAKYKEEFVSIKTKLDHLTAEDKISTGFASAIKAGDIDILSNLIGEAASINFVGPVVDDAQANLARLQEEQTIIEQLSSAIEAADTETLKTLLADADSRGMTGDKVQQARVLADREQLVSDTMAKIAQATSASDLALMNEAWEMVIQLGLSGEEIDAAAVVKDNLSAINDAVKELLATVKTVEVKVYSKGGIVEGDSAPLEGAVAVAKEKGVPESHADFVKASDLLVKMGKQIGVQEQCKAALESGDKKQLKAAMLACDDLELKLEDKDTIKVQLREISEHEAMLLEASGGVVDAPDLDDIDAEQLDADRDQRREDAKNTKYRFWNFSSLRSPDDYAKGTIMGKKKVKDGMLKWQDNLIPKSLLELSRDNSKLAINIHRCLLGYMGDKQMSFPATLAHDILTKGLEGPAIRNEVYVQIMKQLSHNPKPESIARGWQLLCMCVSTFPPTEDFEKFLLNFVLNKMEGMGAVRNYAKYCLRTLEGMITSGASGFVPSVEEISAYKERPPVLATVELVDGQILSEELPVTPDLNVGKITEICAHFLDLEDPRISSLGLFVYDMPGEPDEAELMEPRKKVNPMILDLARTPRPLRNEDYLGDIIVQKARQGRNYKFVFKKKIFLESTNGPSDDPQYRRLLYLQAEDEVITTGGLRVKDETVLFNLIAMSVAYNFGEDYPTTRDAFAEMECISFIPEWIRLTKTEEEWADIVIGLGSSEFANLENADIEVAFVDMIKDMPLYGGHVFFVKVANNTATNLDPPLPERLTLCFREDGLHIMNEGFEELHHYGFSDVIRWGGSSRQFSLVIWDSEEEATYELMLHTAQASDMASAILDHINAIMIAREGDDED